MSTHSDYIVSVRNTTIMQANKVVMEDINFDIASGEFVYLIGKTGSGKTSILKTLYADLELAKGQVQVVGYKIHDIKRKDVPFLRRKLGIIFQDFELFTDRSVEENLKFVMKATGWKDKEEMDDKIEELLELVGLSGIQNKFPHQLSGGEQQRVAIARALINDPLIIIADEPTGNLDPTVAHEILQIFMNVNKEAGTAVLMGTHHHNFLKAHPARVLFCENNQIKDIGKKQVLQRMEIDKRK